MDHSEKIDKFAAAFVAAQKQIKGAAKSAVNPHFRTSYADLASVMEACKEALNANGISVIQTPVPTENTNTLALDTVLMHQSGEWVSGRTVIPLGKVDPQGYGSAMTYARRYSLAAMVGVCPEDDDGEGAMGRGSNGSGARKPQPPPPQRQQPPSAKPGDSETFLIQLNEAFDAKDFTEASREAVIRKVLADAKVDDLAKMPAKWRKPLLDKIAAGKFDSMKVEVANA